MTRDVCVDNDPNSPVAGLRGIRPCVSLASRSAALLCPIKKDEVIVVSLRSPELQLPYKTL